MDTYSKNSISFAGRAAETSKNCRFLPNFLKSCHRKCDFVGCIIETREFLELWEKEVVKMKTKKNGCLAVLEWREEENTCYALLCVQFERAIGYAMYIEREEEHALELIGRQRKEAQEIFAKVVRGGLSPLHLREVAEDSTKLEIFC